MASVAELVVDALRKGALRGSPLLRQGLGFTALALIVARLGTYIPAPGVTPGFMEDVLNQHWNDALGLFDVFTGGAVRRFSLFTLNIAPYLFAVSAIDSGTAVVPALKALKAQGLPGQIRLDRYAMRLTVAVAAVSSFQAAIMLEGLHDAAGPAVPHPGWLFRLTCVVTLTGGSLFLTWLARQINLRGIGAGGEFRTAFSGLGFKLVGTSGLFVSLPVALGSLPDPAKLPFPVWLLLPAAVVLVAFMVFVGQAMRRTPVNEARRTLPNRLGIQGAQSWLPFRANPAGMDPSVSATTVVLFPATIVAHVGVPPAVRHFIDGPLARGQPLYLLLYALVLIALCYPYACKAINPDEIADKMKKQYEYIPGLRPGAATAEYVQATRNRLIAIGAAYLCVVCIPLELLVGRYGFPADFTGAAVVGMITMSLDLTGNLYLDMVPGQYEGLIRPVRRG